MKSVMIEGTVNFDNVKQFCTSDHAELAVKTTGLGNAAYEMYTDGNDGTVYINEAGRSYLYPTPTARPYQMEAWFGSRRYATSSYQKLYVGGTEVWHKDIPNSTSYQLNESGILTNDAISKSTRASELRYDIHVNSTIIAVAITDFGFKFYFWQYEHAAHKAKDARGVDGVTVSNPSPYHGDPVTYTVQLNDKSRWKGWYADEDHTILVSTETTYVVDAADSDVTLYAYATKRQDVDYKLNGEWKEGIVIYEKINGVWTEINKSQIKTDVGYELDRGG